MRRYAVGAVASLLFLFTICAVWAGGSTPAMGQEEIEMGKEASAEAERSLDLLQDEALNERVSSIGNKLAKIANTLEVEAAYGAAVVTPFDYEFKIVNDDEINAFSIPGGHIYINKGLIELCESDHELAGVLAHEIAHAAHHHMAYLLREQAKLHGKVALVLLAGMVGSMRSEDISNIIMGAQFYRTAKINDYGQKAEWDADHTAVQYMINTGYNPVGMLTFLERLAERPDPVDWGVLQTHPASIDRASAVKSLLSDLGVEINRRDVTTSSTAIVERQNEGDKAVYMVQVGQRLICKLGHEPQAQAAADRINALLDANLQFRELKVDGTSVIAQDKLVLKVTEEDAMLAGEAPEQVALNVKIALHDVLFEQLIRDMR